MKFTKEFLIAAVEENKVLFDNLVDFHFIIELIKRDSVIEDWNHNAFEIFTKIVFQKYEKENPNSYISYEGIVKDLKAQFSKSEIRTTGIAWMYVENGEENYYNSESIENRWMKITCKNISSMVCGFYNCQNSATCGAVVKNDMELEGEWIIPTCKTHSTQKPNSIVAFKPGTILVNKSICKDALCIVSNNADSKVRKQYEIKA